MSEADPKLDEVEDPVHKEYLRQLCEGHYRNSLYGGGIIAETKEDIEGIMNEIQGKGESIKRTMQRVEREIELLSNLHTNEITENIRRKQTQNSLTCPLCGSLDHGNKKNGKPWCMNCDAPLLPENEHEEWLMNHKNRERRFVSYTFKEPKGVVRI